MHETIVRIYFRSIRLGAQTLESVPETIRAAVAALLEREP